MRQQNRKHNNQNARDLSGAAGIGLEPQTISGFFLEEELHAELHVPWIAHAGHSSITRKCVV
jgi:hypothetical protein